MTNELILLLTFVLLGMLLLFLTKLGKTYIFIFSVSCIIISNITVAKQVSVFDYSMSLGVIIYSLVYLATDICSEYGSKYDAYRLAISNLVAQIVFFTYIQMSIAVDPAALDSAGNLIEQLFATTPRITIAAIVAAIGAFVDIWIYEAFMRKWKKGKLNVIIRNNTSTFIGQAVNTIVFFFIAFYGVLDNLAQIIFTAIVAKWIIAILDSYFLILAERFVSSEWKSNPSWKSDDDIPMVVADDGKDG